MSNKRVFVSALTEVTSTAKDQVGDIRWIGDKGYKYVKLQNVTATVACVAGDAVAYRAALAHTHHVVSDNTDADGVPVGAGLVQAAIAGVAGTAYYCWIQIKGPGLVAAALSGPPNDGELVHMSTTDKTLARTTAFTQTPVAIAYDVSEKLLLCNFPY